MVRAPCCEKVGLKKGPWSIEEDQILVDYIQRHGHENWRALPKQSGLLRCGKSCRLRWTNYLRPDIKRGNFTKEEEDAIISLHGKLGNRWSAIAANLPGRTDNEIKNVWHTHLKKRVHPKEETQVKKKKKKHDAKTKLVSEVVTLQPDADLDVPRYDNSSFMSASVERSCSDFSSFVTDSCVMSGDATNDVGAEEESFSSEKLERIDESFWLEALSIETSSESMNLTSLEVPPAAAVGETFGLFSSIASDDMEFWLQIFKEAEFLENLTQMNPTD